MRLLALLLVALHVFPAARAAEDCDDIGGLPITHNVRWPQVWQALSQQANCTQNCHLGSQPAAELDFSSERLAIYFLVEQPSAQDPSILRVDPGRPTRSLLYQKISCSRPDVGRPMPPPAGHLPLELQELIYDWIAQGAYGEPAEDPIPRRFIFADSLESRRCVIDGVPVDRHACIGITQPWRGVRP